jgi:hypothetical protein
LYANVGCSEHWDKGRQQVTPVGPAGQFQFAKKNSIASEQAIVSGDARNYRLRAAAGAFLQPMVEV